MRRTELSEVIFIFPYFISPLFFINEASLTSIALLQTGIMLHLNMVQFSEELKLLVCSKPALHRTKQAISASLCFW